MVKSLTAIFVSLALLLGAGLFEWFSWDKRKDRLHIWIPHNDIARLDEHLAEAVRLIGEKEYSLASSKLEIVLHMSKCLPGTYRPEIGNVL